MSSPTQPPRAPSSGTVAPNALPAAPPAPCAGTWLRRSALLLGIALVLVVICELIGPRTLDIGIGTITVFPMVWGILFGAVISVQKYRPIGLTLQKTANAIMGIAVLLLVARLAFNIGPNLPAVADAGPALLLQEVGHVLGTIGLALPLAVLLRMGKATVGATFSLDREPSFAIIGEKYGTESSEYRGVLAMYVFGTLFGAIFITLLASFVSSLDIFDPLALAMGAGVGSGSMLAAGTASITDQYPAQAEAIMGVAATANLITTIFGVYASIYISLPVARRFYTFLTRNRPDEDALVPAAVAAAASSSTATAAAPAAASPAPATGTDAIVADNALVVDNAPLAVPLWLSAGTCMMLGLVTASIVADGFSWGILGGYGVLIALLLISIGLGKLSRVISPIIWITTLGAFLSSQWSPIADTMNEMVAHVDFLSMCTVVLVVAGLGLGKDLPLMRSIGWKIIPVGLASITGTFLFATIIAEFSLGL